jgi:WD40 repeat protein
MQVMCVHYDEATHRLVSGGVDKTVRCWDLRRPDAPLLVHTFADLHQGAVFAVHLRGDSAVSGSSDGTVCVLNFNTKRRR